MCASRSNNASAGERRLFSVEQANAMLPLVRAICEDLARLMKEVVERRERLALLRGGRDRDAADPYSEELHQVEDDLERDSLQLQAYVEELTALGVEPKNGLEGLVDFPSMMDGRVVYLCWKLGEPEVLHWHEVDAGFAGRHPLTADIAMDGGTSGSGTGPATGSGH